MKSRLKTSGVRAFRDAEPSVPLVERLISAGLLSRHQLQLALREQHKDDRSLGQVLLDLGLLSQEILGDTLNELLDHDRVSLRNLIADPEVLAMLPTKIARRYNVLPVNFDSERKLLTLAVPGTLGAAAMDEIAGALDAAIGIETRVADGTEIAAAIERFYRHDLSIAGIVREIDSGDRKAPGDNVEVDGCNHPLVRLVDALLADAIKSGASDMHFEPEAGFVRLRYRIDGVLRQVMALHIAYWPGMAGRLKKLAKIPVRDAAGQEEGRLSLVHRGRPIELRVSCRATIRGEDMVIHIKDPENILRPLERIGFRSKALASLQLMMARPEGLIVVAGPANSGKTSTLYSLLDYRNDESVKIMTLEDRVEWPMAMIRQSSSDRASAGDKPTALASLAHQDADIVLLDEVADGAMAEAAFLAAMSGCQVLTTMHASSALTAVLRFSQLGIDPRVVARNTIGIVAQRLVRRLCPSCKKAYSPEAAERKLLGITAAKPLRLYREGGCASCDFRGYQGRIGVFEILKINDELEDMIASAATPRELRNAATASGFKDIVHDAVHHVLHGTTSLDEVSRVVDLTGRLREAV